MVAVRSCTERGASAAARAAVGGGGGGAAPCCSASASRARGRSAALAWRLPLRLRAPRLEATLEEGASEGAGALSCISCRPSPTAETDTSMQRAPAASSATAAAASSSAARGPASSTPPPSAPPGDVAASAPGPACLARGDAGASSPALRSTTPSCGLASRRAPAPSWTQAARESALTRVRLRRRRVREGPTRIKGSSSSRWSRPGSTSRCPPPSYSRAEVPGRSASSRTQGDSHRSPSATCGASARCAAPQRSVSARSSKKKIEQRTRERSGRK
jgi:hypothetical protein